MQKKYDKKVVSTLAFSLGVVSILFAISFCFNFFGGFELKPTETFDKILGENISVEMTDYGSQSVGLIFSGKSLPGDKIKQSIQIKMPNLDLSQYKLRAKAYVGHSDNSTNVELLGFGFWERGEDGYYYYKNNPQKLQEIGVCTDIVLPQNISLKSNVNYVLIFTVELISVL